MSYFLGARSLGFLANVDPVLIAVVKKAISLSTQDFCFTEPQFRTLAQERDLVARGVSHTLKSHHLAQANGLGGAVDAVPWNGTIPVWDWGMLYQVASAFKWAGHFLGVELTWGGVWDRTLNEIDGFTPADMAAAEAAYVTREHGLGIERVLVDGPHFELGRN